MRRLSVALPLSNSPPVMNTRPERRWITPARRPAGANPEAKAANYWKARPPFGPARSAAMPPIPQPDAPLGSARSAAARGCPSLATPAVNRGRHNQHDRVHVTFHVAGHDWWDGHGGTEQTPSSNAPTSRVWSSHVTGSGDCRSQGRTGADTARPDQGSPDGLKAPSQ
jgi:hypothetical protein